MKTEQTKYLVIDTHTREVKGSYKTRKAASNRADKLDNAYGAYRYSVRPDFLGTN